MSPLKSKSLSAALLLAALLLPCRAEVKPHALFSDNAVLQQGTDVPVWGAAREGEKVTVSIAGQEASTVAKAGKWLVRLKNIAPGGPYTMTLRGDNEITLSNLLVGEVWVCSGQSNMERQVGLRQGQQPLKNWEQEVAAANYPQLRHFKVKQTTADTPLSEVTGTWEVCSPQTVANFTAVGYFFGRDLQQAIKAPIGLIHSSWGGTPAEAWTRHEVLRDDPVLKGILETQAKALETYPERLAKYKAEEPKLLEEHNAAVEKAKQTGATPPRKPAAPVNPTTDKNRPSGLYNGMVYPIIPYAMRGVIWYQGESNSGRAKVYQTLFPSMIRDWRAQWGRGDFPFLFVQIAPHQGQSPEIREAQLLTFQRTPNTAMAVLTDCGDAKDIHPTHKQPVGARLALAARALAYGEKIEFSGPLYDTLTVKGSEAIISFTHLGGGLDFKGEAPKGFMIAGEDRNFVPATVKIVGDTLVVSSSAVAKPVAVRYGWANVPDVNLYNKLGLPASPFRTDGWEK